uniref:Family with sequence similarity 168 member A n=1 Tax=Anas platyrhynchos platyrhynchos TaxID=8840 RepID=A0A493TB30_ANAPP
MLMISHGAPSSSFLRRGQLGTRQFVKNVMNFSLSLVAGYPTGYPTAAPAYNPNMYPTSSPGYAPATLLMKQAWPQTSSSCATEGTFHLPVDTGTENRTYQASSAAFRYTAGTPYKVPPTQSNNAPPPYSPSPNPYQTAMYPIRSAYPQQNLYTQVRASLLASGPGQLRILRGRGRGRQ